MSGFGAIKDGTELADYDTEYSFFRALGYTSLGITTGTLLLGGVVYAGYLKMKNRPKPTKKPKKEK